MVPAAVSAAHRSHSTNTHMRRLGRPPRKLRRVREQPRLRALDLHDRLGKLCHAEEWARPVGRQGRVPSRLDLLDPLVEDAVGGTLIAIRYKYSY